MCLSCVDEQKKERVVFSNILMSSRKVEEERDKRR